MTPNTFLPREHWKDFENFALRVVEVKIHDSIIYDHLYSWRTKDTRDEGVDGQILLTVAGGNLRITVEAKLRKGGKIALRDIASSLINYLVNYSNVHFVVTNVCFTDDAYRIANSINSRGVFSVNYLDCSALSSCLETHPELEQAFQTLAKNVRQHAMESKCSNAKTEPPIHANALSVLPYLTTSREFALKEILEAVQDRVPLIALYGPRGSDKSLVLERCMQELSSKSPVMRIDMQYIDSSRTFLIALLKNTLGLNIFEYWELLSDKEYEDEWNAVCIDYSRVKIVRALRELLHSHMENDPTQENYFIQEFFREAAKINPAFRILILENLNMVTPETLLSMMNLFSCMADCNFSVVVELSTSTPCGVCAIDASIWYSQIQQIKSMRLHGTSTKWVAMEDLPEEEAIALLSFMTAQPTNSHFLHTILQRFGRSPAVLREVVSIVVNKHITTSSELWLLPAPGSPDALETNLLTITNRVHSIGKENLRAFRWCLQALVILYGQLSIELIAIIEDHFLVSGTARALEQTEFVYSTGDSWRLRSEREKTILEKMVNGWDKRELIGLLIRNRKSWALPEVIAAYVEANMFIDRATPLFIQTAEKAIRVCLNNGEDRLAARLLRTCADRTKNADSVEKRSQYVDFALKTLALDQKLGLTPVEEIEAEGEILLGQCTELYQSSKCKGTAELLIRCNLMKNHLLRHRFNYFDGESYIRDCFVLAKKYGLEKWGAQAYVAMALCVKERGSHTKCFDIFRQGIRAYPKNQYLRSCYLANYAAHQAKTNLSSAIRCVQAALVAAENYDDKELCCWLQEDLFMYRIENGENTPALLEEIKNCRRCADRYGFRSDISRTYNLEGVFYAVKGDLEYAAKCFRRSIQCYDESISDQQKFLFRSNLLAVLPFQHEESTSHLEQQLLWLQRNHALLAKKLLSRKELQAETNYAAVAIILKVTQLKKRSSDFQKIQAWFPLAPITNTRYEKSINLHELLSPRFFPTSRQALILF